MRVTLVTRKQRKIEETETMRKVVYETVSRPKKDAAGEQKVGVAVVVAFELDDLVAARKGPRQAEGAHRRLGAGVDKADHLQGGHKVHHQPRQVEFERARRPEARPLPRRLHQGVHHYRRRMPQDERPEGEHIIHVSTAVHIDEVGPFAALDEQRLAADGFEGARGRVYAARQQVERLLKEPDGGVDGGQGRVGHGGFWIADDGFFTSFRIKRTPLSH